MSYRGTHRQRKPLSRRPLPRAAAAVAVVASLLSAPLATGTAHAGVNLPPGFGVPCDACVTIATNLVSEAEGIVLDLPNQAITVAGQAVGMVDDCINDNNAACNLVLNEVQTITTTAENDITACVANAPGSPCNTITTDVVALVQKLQGDVAQCLQDSASVCNAALKQANTVVTDVQNVVSDCTSNAPASLCTTASQAVNAVLAEANDQLDQCMNHSESICQTAIHQAIAQISSTEAQAEAMLTQEPSDGGGTLPYINISDFQVTTLGSGEQQLAYATAQNAIDAGYATADPPVSNVYELPIVPQPVADTGGTAADLTSSTTAPVLEVIVGQPGQDFHVVGVHSDDGSLLGYTVAGVAPALIGMPVTTYGIAAKTGTPTTGASGKWYATNDPQCFGDASYYWVKTMCWQYEIQDTSDNGNYYFQFQYWSAGRGNHNFPIDKFWLEGHPDTHDTPGMRYNGAASPEQAYDGSGSTCRGSTAGLTITSGEPYSVGFNETDSYTTCEHYDPQQYADTANDGHYAIIWYGNPATASQRYIKMNVALKCSVNSNGVEYDLWFGQRVHRDS